ncbi:hypothetical protein I6Y99_004999 [Vibrio parahaemolyticus]|uniref:hypothetical protein n=1 Tax=Vibrio parahaemolyticus TaxID=670 RepID=UPI0004DB63CF|nr:hypothetical protein [Vibrio parahaemolyticus]HDV5446298.1 hypothetical protein [Vibrio cholerae]EGQ7810930.1 hypothetical protein [Vibrio parahaemolyticus]EGQ8536382.1 hypothetical protein [Vibrio parahaemolyticus]EHD0108210.1 hypothetical protein [Vibrio parahaemolyticus]EIV8651585.1 hypothetical protein [Vibrio parahaemolyticus]
MDTFEIVAEISDATVTPAIEALQAAVEGNEIKIHLPYNVGGSVSSAVNLITAVDETVATVIIELDRYAISAAAFIWAWFFLRPKANVTVQTTGEPAVLVYHRPRIPVDDHLLFIDDLIDGHDLKDSLQEATELFDELFEELIAAIGYVGDNEAIYDYQSVQIKHKFKHARDGYYLNQDCVIPA